MLPEFNDYYGIAVLKFCSSKVYENRRNTNGYIENFRESLIRKGSVLHRLNNHLIQVLITWTGLKAQAGWSTCPAKPGQTPGQSN